MYIKCHKCTSMFELEDEWGNQPDIDFPCPSCNTSMTVRRNRVANPAAPAPAPSQSPPKSDRTMVMPDMDDAPSSQPVAPRRPSAPAQQPPVPAQAPPAKSDRTMMMPELDEGPPPLGGGGDATMMMAPVSDDFLADTGAGNVEATAFIDTSRKGPAAPPASNPVNSSESLAFEPTGFMPAMGQDQHDAPAEATAFLSTSGPSAPEEADRTAFLQSPVSSHGPSNGEAEATMFIQADAPPSRPAAPPRPASSHSQQDLHVDQVSGEATMFIDAPASAPSRPHSSAPNTQGVSSLPSRNDQPHSSGGDLHGDSTQMVSAVDEAALQSFLAKRQSKGEQQQRYAEENRGIRELNPGGGTAVVGAMSDGVPPMQGGQPAPAGPPPEWGQIPKVAADKQQGAPKAQAKKGKGAKAGAPKKKGGAFKWILILLILGGLGYGGYYAYITWF